MVFPYISIDIPLNFLSDLRISQESTHPSSHPFPTSGPAMPSTLTPTGAAQVVVLVVWKGFHRWFLLGDIEFDVYD